MAIRDNGCVAVGAHGTVLTSPDGITWTTRSTGSAHYLYDVAWTGSQLVAVGAGSSVFTSPDAITWKRRYVPVGQDLYAIVKLEYCGGSLLSHDREVVCRR